MYDEQSLALGQNPSYINRIENGHALPSLSIFLVLVYKSGHEKLNDL